MTGVLVTGQDRAGHVAAPRRGDDDLKLRPLQSSHIRLLPLVGAMMTGLPELYASGMT